MGIRYSHGAHVGKTEFFFKKIKSKCLCQCSIAGLRQHGLGDSYKGKDLVEACLEFPLSLWRKVWGWMEKVLRGVHLDPREAGQK